MICHEVPLGSNHPLPAGLFFCRRIFAIINKFGELLRYRPAAQGFSRGDWFIDFVFKFRDETPFLFTRFLLQKLKYVLIYVFHCMEFEDGSMSFELDPRYRLI